MKVKSALIAIATLWFSQAAIAQMTVPFVTGEWSPLVSEALPNKGPAVELIVAISKAAGITPVIKFLPWARAEMMVQDGEVFAAFPYADTTERRAKFLMSEPIFGMQGRFIAYSGNPSTPAKIVDKGLEEMKNSEVGVTLGNFIINQLKSSGYNKVIVTDDVDKSIQMLQAGRITYFAEAPIVAFESIKKLAPSEANKFFIMNNTPLPRSENGLIVSKSYPDASIILRKFNEGLASVKKSGEYKKILDKYKLSSKVKSGDLSN